MLILHIAGNLGKDPETRFTPSGQKVTTFTVAVNQRKGKEDVTTWVRVTVWEDRFDKILSYLKKGSSVIVVGSLAPPSSYTDKEGRTQVSLEIRADIIQFSPFGRTDRQGDGATSQQAMGQHEEGQFQVNASNQYKAPQYAPQTSGQGSYGQAIDEDTLPF